MQNNVGSACAVTAAFVLWAGGLSLQRSNFSMDGVLFTNNSAYYGGSLFVGANLTSSIALRKLTFANDDTGIRGESSIP